MSAIEPVSGIPAVDRYLVDGYASVIGMSSRFAAAISGGLMRIQTELGVTGHVAEIGAFEGRYFIALAHALAPGEKVLGIDHFEWPNAGVLDRFERNCAKHGVPAERRITWKANSGDMQPDDILAKLGGERVRFFHVDGDHATTSLAGDLEMATAVLAPAAISTTSTTCSIT